jgi:hypothetical protein
MIDSMFDFISRFALHFDDRLFYFVHEEENHNLGRRSGMAKATLAAAAFPLWEKIYATIGAFSIAARLCPGNDEPGRAQSSGSFVVLRPGWMSEGRRAPRKRARFR